MINFGIIGTSWITHSFIRGAQSSGKWNLAAVYSRKEETAKEFASKYEGQKVTLHTSLDALANDANITAVYVASPNILHYAQAKQMLQAGKHVVVEKPSCSTVEELEDLFKLAKEKKVILVEAFRHIQEANFKILKQSMEKLGPIYGASITYAQYSARYEQVLAGEVPNIFNLEMGGGALVDLGVYCVSAALDLFGAPDKSTYWPVTIATGCDGAGKIILQYPKFSVYLCHSKIYHSDTVSEIYGEKGTLIFSSVTDIESVVFRDAKTKTKTELAGKKEPADLNLKEEAVEFARLIEEEDWKSMEKYETLSMGILKVLENSRKENGLLFPGGI
ncbi:NAD(P)-binding protein [Dothidotthia symphoricarpi CBS 119687]|uniref:NAD(P)-binding protein n=1 Tax=Dothidotthia symphoricarpi CBS 119687 TaxID=1392245 RepID=A0A6A6A7P7_9PLEO|nr:NAD(P)-binding protein [Dothidotthia symphoricarpi CBS 119687]KAF2126818.1 NAD(P)-binding protein [Dothidotthia symphoricarpi CBS 119687]